MPVGILPPLASSTLDLPPGSYIYSVIETSDGYAIISSDDSLRVFDGAAMKLRPGGCIERTHAGVTCLKTLDDEGNILATAGRDGSARCWDMRNGKQAAEYRAVKDAPLLSLECSHQRKSLVAGTELCNSQACVITWDVRNPTSPQLQYVESHNDDITEVQYHPAQPNLLLSGSTDGLVNIYDTTISDEEDALYQVINHGSSIHHAGFLSDLDIYALSHDETLSIHQLANPGEDTEEPSPTVFGDLREKLGCGYAVDVLRSSQGARIGVGSHSEHRLDLVPLQRGQPWSLDQSSVWRIAGAHGEEIVRSFCTDQKSNTVYTAGEDGCVRSWRAPDVADYSTGEAIESTGSNKRHVVKAKGDRYKPY